MFLIDGVKEIRSAIDAGISVSTLWLSSDSVGMDSSFGDDMRHAIQWVAPEILCRISYGQRGDDPVAVASMPSTTLSDVALKSTDLVLVLDRIEKPGNLGACLRSAAACRVSAVILTSPVCDVFNPNTIRASRGAIFSVPIAVCEASELQRFLTSVGIPVFAARVDATCQLWDCRFSHGAAVVFGSESQGLGHDWRFAQVQDFTIPMEPTIDSLNVSISAAVTLYEAFRQRTLG